MAKKALNLTQEQMLLVGAILIVGGYFLYTNYFTAYADTYTIANTGTGTITCYMAKYNDGKTFTISEGNSFSYAPPMPGDFDSGKCYCPATYQTNYQNIEFPHSGSYLTFNVNLPCSGSVTTTTEDVTTTSPPSSCSDTQLKSLADTDHDCNIDSSEVTSLASKAFDPEWLTLYPYLPSCVSKLSSRLNNGYTTYPSCSPTTTTTQPSSCSDTQLKTLADLDKDCNIDSSEVTTLAQKAFSQEWLVLYPYLPSCVSKLSSRINNGYTTYASCSPTTTTTITQSCESAGYYSTPQSGMTCSQAFVSQIGRYCYSCMGGTTTTTIVPPCVGLDCYDDVIIGVVLGVGLLGVGYFIFKKK